MYTYECYNTTTGDVEGYQEMDFDEAVERNRTLRQNGEPQRWLQVPVEEEETSTGEWETPYDNGLRPDELGEYDVPNEYNDGPLLSEQEEICSNCKKQIFGTIIRDGQERYHFGCYKEGLFLKQE